MRSLNFTAAFIFLVAYVTPITSAVAQQETKIQSVYRIRGSVRDAVSNVPIVGATVRVNNVDSVIAGAIVSRSGDFRIEKVQIGRYRVEVTMVGYEPYVIPELTVTSGKEVVLSITLQTAYVSKAEVAVVDYRSKDEAVTNSEFVAVSGHTFRPEETRLYPGSIGDPARMVQNYAGVLGANDARNDIVVRGNSPLGTLYRMEGMNIPNPSHYGALTSGGGVVSMLNNNVLEKSDFLAGAFPAEYGNALSGVFDLRTRRGNDEQFEFVAQMSFSGIEAGVEGPMWEGSSFVANYRYSTLSAFAALGLDVGVGSAIPVYQDVTFNATTELFGGRLTLFGTLGRSRINFIGDDVDTVRRNAYSEPDRNIRVSYASGWSGISFERSFGFDTYARLLVGGSTTRETYEGDSLNPITRLPYTDEENDFATLRWTTTGFLRHRIGRELVVSGGYFIDGTSYSLYSVLDRGLVTQYTPVDVTSAMVSIQTYAQAQWRPMDALAINAGINILSSSLGKTTAVEPRAGVVLQLSPVMSLRAGYGAHSQMQNLYVYNVQIRDRGEETLYPNRNLGLTRSQHAVVEWSWFLAEHTRMRLEAYSQWLDDVPVEQTPSSYSALNAGADFFPTPKAFLVNGGSGRNIGVEFTIERFLREGLYYMLTGSLFSSRYVGSDGIDRNTAFNNGYVVNVLAGYQYRVTPSNSLTISFRLNSSGGRYLTPIDLAASSLAGRVVYDEQRAFSERQSPYFRSDVRIGYQMEFSNSTLEIAIDLMNITNHQNIFIQTFNPRAQAIATQYQQGFIPVPTVRWTF